ncbi:MAG: ankyrin repeat domain-containing protein [Simkaniaceae bacterium]|nr:ankyrin repeat domain-containing protein [Simkaniaceae bacterium]
MAGGALSFSILSRVIIPMTALHIVEVVLCSAVCSATLGFAVHALKGALWEGSALRQAVLEGAPEEVRRLCKSGVQVDLPDEEGERALTYAIRKGNVEIVRELLKHGADTACVDEDNRTPLMLAAKRGRPEIAKVLIARGADVNAYNDDYETPLWLAMKHGRTETVRELLALDARLPVVPTTERTYGLDLAHPLLDMVIKGYTEIVEEWLEKGADVGIDRTGGMWGHTPLTVVAGKSSREKIVEKLLESGADVNCVDDQGDTPLTRACQAGCTEIVRKFLEVGARVDYVHPFSRWTALMYATEQGHTEIVAILIEARADLRHIDRDGRNVLVYAVKKGRLEIVKQLCRANHEYNFINSTDCDGFTPLMYAVDTDDAEIAIVEKLLKYDADVNQPDCVGRTPLIATTKRGRSDIVKRLLKVKALVVDRADRDGWTPLMFAVEQGDIDIVRALLQRRADPNRHDHKGVTPLIIAAKLGRKDIAEELVGCGADPLHADDTNNTALDWARKESHGETIALLEQARATWEQKGKK